MYMLSFEAIREDNTFINNLEFKCGDIKRLAPIINSIIDYAVQYGYNVVFKFWKAED